MAVVFPVLTGLIVQIMFMLKLHKHKTEMNNSNSRNGGAWLEITDDCQQKEEELSRHLRSVLVQTFNLKGLPALGCCPAPSSLS